MKKKFLVSLALLLVASLQAAHINQPTALKVASNFFNQSTVSSLGGGTQGNLELAYTYVQRLPGIDNQTAENILIYVFNQSHSKGFVLVSGDDRVSPILAYSLQGAYTQTNVPPALQKMIEGYKQQIIYAQGQNLQPSTEIATTWAKLLANQAIPSKSSKAVNPLLTTTWDQAPYYNALCPYDNVAGEYTVTGCPATAMAQIMKYWNYPLQGTGFHSYNDPQYGTQTANFASTTYNWSAMPTNVGSANNAVATLMYHCGVSVETNYGIASSGGSGAYVISAASAGTHCCEYAFKTYFGYNPATLKGLLRSNYTDEAWKNLLKADLNNAMPIQYAGYGSGGGHTFVCDGYDANDFFHMNWGWGGYYDGYFLLDALNPGGIGIGGGTGGFNSNQQALLGIQPLTSASTPTLSLNASIDVTPNSVLFYNSFTVHTDIMNTGNSSFSGDYCAALFNSEGAFLNFVEILSTGSNPLPPGYHYTDGLTFASNGMIASPGANTIGIYYRPVNGEWVLAGKASFTNPVDVTFHGPFNPLNLYSDIVADPPTFINGEPASITVNFYNTNTYTYYGKYQAVLYDLEGNFVQSLGSYDETNGLPSEYIYNAPYITFTCNAIQADPGTYMLAIIETENGSSISYFVGAKYFGNPITMVVMAPQLEPDPFEDNNVENKAYPLELTWNNNQAKCLTSSSNNHVGTDYDYYKLQLATGYKYSITARVHDSYNSGNGITYSNDVLWSYNKGGAWSDVFDDIMNESIVINGAGELVFMVAPYFAGQTGTYLLDISIARTVANGLIDGTVQSIVLEPNPVQDWIKVSVHPFTKQSQWQILDVTGKQVKQGLLDAESQLINVSGLCKGMYVMVVETGNQLLKQRFIRN